MIKRIFSLMLTLCLLLAVLPMPVLAAELLQRKQAASSGSSAWV